MALTFSKSIGFCMRSKMNMIAKAYLVHEPSRILTIRVLKRDGATEINGLLKFNEYAVAWKESVNIFGIETVR